MLIDAREPRHDIVPKTRVWLKQVGLLVVLFSMRTSNLDELLSNAGTVNIPRHWDQE